MKTLYSITVFLGALAASGAGGPVYAQPVAPSDTSRPVISPGKAGPQGSEGARPAKHAAPVEITAGEIMTRPGDYAGRNVAVTSELEEIFTQWAVRIDDDSLITGGIDNDLLVVAARPLASMGVDRSWLNKEVRVTGTVRVLQAEDFRREYGRGVDDKLFRRYEGKPALIATSVTLVEGAAPTSGAGGASGSGAAVSRKEAEPAEPPGASAECPPSSGDCPPPASSGSSVISTDSQPIGSAPPRGRTISESEYPTSPGSGSAGSGVTGTPTGPAPGPTLGIGR